MVNHRTGAATVSLRTRSGRLEHICVCWWFPHLELDEHSRVVAIARSGLYTRISSIKCVVQMETGENCFRSSCNIKGSVRRWMFIAREWFKRFKEWRITTVNIKDGRQQHQKRTTTISKTDDNNIINWSVKSVVWVSALILVINEDPICGRTSPGWLPQIMCQPCLWTRSLWNTTPLCWTTHRTDPASCDVLFLRSIRRQNFTLWNVAGFSTPHRFAVINDFFFVFLNNAFWIFYCSLALNYDFQKFIWILFSFGIWSLN